MFVLNSNRTQLINLATVKEFYIKSNGRGIQVEFVSGSGCNFEVYDNIKVAEKALEYIIQNIDKNIIMPSEDKLLEMIKQIPERKIYHVKGKKNKGYGGS